MEVNVISQRKVLVWEDSRAIYNHTMPSIVESNAKIKVAVCSSSGIRKINTKQRYMRVERPWMLSRARTHTHSNAKTPGQNSKPRKISFPPCSSRCCLVGISYASKKIYCTVISSSISLFFVGLMVSISDLLINQ